MELRRSTINPLRKLEGIRLVTEVGAYLDGRYLERVARRWRHIPAWAFLNHVAHRDLEHLQQRFKPPRLSRRSSGELAGWIRASKVVSNELSALVGKDPLLLRRIQQTVLEPLESSLIATPDGDAPTPRELVALVRAALRAASY